MPWILAALAGLWLLRNKPWKGRDSDVTTTTSGVSLDASTTVRGPAPMVVSGPRPPAPTPGTSGVGGSSSSGTASLGGAIGGFIDAGAEFLDFIDGDD